MKTGLKYLKLEWINQRNCWEGEIFYPIRIFIQLYHFDGSHFLLETNFSFQRTLVRLFQVDCTADMVFVSLF